MPDYSKNAYFNYNKPVEEKEVPLREQVNVPTDLPNLVRTPETGDKVYLVKDGEFHWVTSPEVLNAVGGGFDMVQLIKRDVFKQLRQGDKLTMENADSFRLPVKEVVEAPVMPVNEFKTYEEGEIPLSMVPDPKVTSIIIPVYWKNYNLWHMTGNCIGSIREHTDKVNTPYEIILVINGDNENVVRMDDLKLTYADKVITNDENLGYAKAVNQGIRCAKGGYIAIVNNDVLVFDHWLKDMQDALEFDLNLVMATPMYGKPFARAVEARELREKTLGNTFDRDVSDFKDFSCVLTRKDVFNKVGLFDEQFFMYCEDLDFMRRMDKEGLKYASTKRVNTSHIISATASGIDETPVIMNESKEKLKAKWGF